MIATYHSNQDKFKNKKKKLSQKRIHDLSVAADPKTSQSILLHFLSRNDGQLTNIVMQNPSLPIYKISEFARSNAKISEKLLLLNNPSTPDNIIIEMISNLEILEAISNFSSDKFIRIKPTILEVILNNFQAYQISRFFMKTYYLRNFLSDELIILCLNKITTFEVGTFAQFANNISYVVALHLLSIKDERTTRLLLENPNLPPELKIFT